MGIPESSPFPQRVFLNKELLTLIRFYIKVADALILNPTPLASEAIGHSQSLFRFSSPFLQAVNRNKMLNKSC